MVEMENRFNLAEILPAFFTLIAGVIFGGSMVVLTPPFDVPEEWQHFFRCYQISQRTIYATLDDMGVPGGEVPVSFLKASAVIHAGLRDEYDFQISPEKFQRMASFPLQPGKKRVCVFPSTARFSPVPYLPAAVAMYVGRHFRLSPLALFYMGRASTLAAYLALVVAAVWLMPIHKWFMVLVALMPMSIFLAASLSADALSIAFSLLAIAMILRLVLLSGPLERRSLIGLGTVLTLLALTKPPYNLIAFFFLAVPPDKFASQGQCWRARAWMILLPIAVAFAWTWSARDACVPYRPCADVHAQTLWMLANPWSFVERVVARLTDGNLYAGIIATLGWGTIWIASSVYYLYWGGLIAAVVLDGSQDRLRLPISARRLP